MKVKREIEVINNLIRLLNNCLVIAITHKRKDEIQEIRKDIALCKAELNKLLDQLKDEEKKLKGEAEGAAI
jgi:hypothetical protein